MYDPTGNARVRQDQAVIFEEEAPSSALRDIVHRWIQVRTEGKREDPYRFHALPDACTYLIFSQDDPTICGVTRLRATSRELNLGCSFHFTNVRLFPGVWLGDVATGIIDTPYSGELPLVEVNRRLVGLSFPEQVPILEEFIAHLHARGNLEPNPTTGRIFDHGEEIGSVSDMARIAHLSPRQLQRVIKRSVGLAPHDFLKILRLQGTLREGEGSSYADQAHFIRSFRSATGYTPGAFARRFDV